jgi:hypothetical protein
MWLLLARARMAWANLHPSTLTGSIQGCWLMRKADRLKPFVIPVRKTRKVLTQRDQRRIFMCVLFWLYPGYVVRHVALLEEAQQVHSGQQEASCWATPAPKIRSKGNGDGGIPTPGDGHFLALPCNDVCQSVCHRKLQSSGLWWFIRWAVLYGFFSPASQVECCEP